MPSQRKARVKTGFFFPGFVLIFRSPPIPLLSSPLKGEGLGGGRSALIFSYCELSLPPFGRANDCWNLSRKDRPRV
jgi:hypothetical protein